MAAPSAIEGKSGDAVTFHRRCEPFVEPRSESLLSAAVVRRLLVTRTNMQDRRMFRCFDLDSEGGLIRLRVGRTSGLLPDRSVRLQWITPFSRVRRNARAMQTFYK